MHTQKVRWIPGLNKNYAINGPLLKVDPNRNLIIEIRSLVGGNPCYYANDFSVLINNRYGFYCRQNCNFEENAKVVCDLITGTVECYANGVLIETYQKIDFRAEEGIQVGLSCRYSEKWEVDEIIIYQ
jgi:hypothetical protein